VQQSKCQKFLLKLLYAPLKSFSHKSLFACSSKRLSEVFHIKIFAKAFVCSSKKLLALKPKDF